MWVEVCESPDDLTTEAIDYFMNIFATKPNGSELLTTFSIDGISRILHIFVSNADRCKSLEATRKMFDLFLRKIHAENTIELPSSNLTPDEISILEYVGGYSLRKLKRNGDEEELAILAKLEDSIYCFVPSDNSLISILQCNEYGTLLKPNQTLLDVLKFSEINFRNHATLKDTISNAISSLDLSELHDITNNYDLDAYVLQRVGHLFFKIRSFQKTKVLKSKLSSLYRW
ncbi:unnamed protein product [Clavelina lepadiformis]